MLYGSDLSVTCNYIRIFHRYHQVSVSVVTLKNLTKSFYLFFNGYDGVFEMPIIRGMYLPV